MIDLVALKNEITTDPKALGYAPYVTAMSDATLANLLNATTGAGAATITLPTLTYAEMLTGLMPALIAIASSTTAIQGKYDRILSAIKTLPVIQYAVAAPILADLVTDGLETQAQIDTFTKRTGSRAEYLWGAGTVITHTQVSHAFGRTA